MKKSNNPKRNQIELFVDHGQFDTEDIGCIKQLLDDAGAKLDHAESHEITGTPVFRCADGKWYTGSVEFIVNPVNPAYLADILADGEHCLCPHCGHIDNHGDMADIGPEDKDGDGLCTKCTHISFFIRAKEAAILAGITKPKRLRRRGGLK